MAVMLTQTVLLWGFVVLGKFGLNRILSRLVYNPRNQRDLLKLEKNIFNLVEH